MARLAFFGTPDLAATCFQALLDARERGHDVVMAVCQPDRPKGRGQKLEPPPVKAAALAHGVPVLQPSTLKQGTPDGDAFFQQFVDAKVDLAVVAAYGRILPRRLLAVPPRGVVNVHGSLLPRWRGAAPIQRAIEAGDPVTGVCLMHMVFELDAGDVYAARQIPIAPDDDAETLGHKVAALGRDMLTEHLDALLAGALPRTPQPAEGVTYAKMLVKDEGRVDFTRPARQVIDHARAMHPWPGAFTTWNGEVLKLFRPALIGGRAAPGTVITAKDTLVVATGEHAVAFAEVQLPGKRRMTVQELMAGRPIAPGTVLG